MSVLIKGMEMPKHLDINGDHDSIFRGVIVVHKDGTAEFVVNLAGESTFARCNNSQLERFPCVDVPTPHGRLIDAEILSKSFDWKHLANTSDEIAQTLYSLGQTTIEAIQETPAIIEAEVSKNA